jgi:catechol 2,3-dioxygenase-like lactoylglutathione lyase family enzyme
MGSGGIHHIYVTTHDLEGTVEFWMGLGFMIGFRTDHGSAQLLPPDDGPYLFVDTAAAGETPRVEVYLDADCTDDDTWHTTHWGTKVRQLRDPDGRAVWLQHQP